MSTTPVTVTISDTSPGAIQNRVQQIQAAAKGTDSVPAFTLTGGALQNLQLQIYALQNAIKSISGAVNTNSGIAGTVIQEVLAPNGVTTSIAPSSTPKAAWQLFVFVAQDSTGGGLISWSSLFREVVTNIDTTANTFSTFSFIGRIDPLDGIVRWFSVCAPLTGQV